MMIVEKSFAVVESAFDLEKRFLSCRCFRFCGPSALRIVVVAVAVLVIDSDFVSKTIDGFIMSLVFLLQFGNLLAQFHSCCLMTFNFARFHHQMHRRWQQCLLVLPQDVGMIFFVFVRHKRDSKLVRQKSSRPDTLALGVGTYRLGYGKQVLTHTMTTRNELAILATNRFANMSGERLCTNIAFRLTV